MSFSRNSEKVKTFNTTDSTANIPLNTGNCSFFTNQEIKTKIHPNFHNRPSSVAKSQKLINDFKKTLQETNKITSLIDIDTSKCNIINNEIPNPNEQTSAESVSEEEIIARLKISNEVLVKANMELKNRNKILTNEINQYKNCAIYKNPYSQYDTNLNQFIEDLKTSLEQSQMSNFEMQELVEKANKNSELLTKSNQELIKNFEICKSEYEKLTQDNSELKAIIQNRNIEIERLNDIINQQNEKMINMESMIQTNDKQINYLNTINTSNLKTQEDHAKLVDHLKNTIENLEKKNTNNFNDIKNLNITIDQLNENLKTKSIQIEHFQNGLEQKIEENQNLESKIYSLEKMLNEQKTINSQHKDDIQKELFEKEKLKTQIEALNVFLNDRNKTIQTLQNSIAFLSKTFDNDLTNITGMTEENSKRESVKSESNNEVLSELIQNLQKKIVDLQKTNKQINFEKDQLKNEINEYEEQFEQSKYDYQILYQKYKEQSELIEKLKNEFMNNRKDQELNNLIKANEEIMNKLQKIKEENKAKTKELIILKKNYERVNTQLMESQRSNSQYNTITDREKTKNINDNPPQKNKNFVGEINDLEYSQS